MTQVRVDGDVLDDLEDVAPSYCRSHSARVEWALHQVKDMETRP